jgi:UDP-glucose 4-epimerase
MPTQAWLITGGAGYIGSHVADTFLANGQEVVIYDSLYRGLASRVEFLREKYQREIPMIIADIRDTDKFEDALNLHKPMGVVHCAALKSVSESLEKPDEYFEVNLHATSRILDLLDKHDVSYFIFSSTAAVYATSNNSNYLNESERKGPLSPYGASKLAAEDVVGRFLAKSGKIGTSLRLFNVVGARSPELYDNSTDNLVPQVIKKLETGHAPIIYGLDYPTPDGSCVRDYIDVRDIANIHLLIANSSLQIPSAINVGTGHGTSVKEVIELISARAGAIDLSVSEKARREGDVAIVCADISLLTHALGYSPHYSLAESIDSLFKVIS